MHFFYPVSACAIPIFIRLRYLLFEKSNFSGLFMRNPFYILLTCLMMAFHHRHHHVQEGLGLIPVPCILKMKLVPPSLPRSSYVSSSFWFIS